MREGSEGGREGGKKDPPLSFASRIRTAAPVFFSLAQTSCGLAVGTL